MHQKDDIAFVNISPEDANMFHLYHTMLHGENIIYYRNAKECEALGTAHIKDFIVNTLKSNNEKLYVLKNMTTREIYAHIHLQAGQTARSRHKADFYLGVLKQFNHMGIGTRLMEIADMWAEKANVEKLQIAVFANNDNAIRFYTKHGYVEESRLKKAVKYSANNYVDEIIMSKFLPNVQQLKQEQEQKQESA